MKRLSKEDEARLREVRAAFGYQDPLPAKASPRRGPAQQGRGSGPGRALSKAQPAPRTKPRRSAQAGGERLHKVMAQAGVASRRHSEALIAAGRVMVNGEVVTRLGTRVGPHDQILVDGVPLGQPEELVYVLLYKPKGTITTLFDPQGRPTVMGLLREVKGRVYPVGRLDFDTEGLLLLTNDGDLAHGLAHPSHEVKKTYLARVRGVPGAEKLRTLERGVQLDDGPTAPAKVKLVKVYDQNSSLVSLTIHEGRNRQVRRMLEAVGHEVISLKRTRLGPLTLKGLAPGEWRYLKGVEVRQLYNQARLQARRSRGKSARPR